MHFRNLTHADLEAPMELPGLRDWLGGLRPTDVALLILAPAGTGKSAAVGHIAHRRNEGVMLCNLMEVLDVPNPEQQLASLLVACETQREPEAVARESERGETARCLEIAGCERERAVQHAVGLDVVGRIAGLAGALLVREPKQVEAANAVRPRAQARLKRGHERLRVSCCEACGELGRAALRDRRRAGTLGGQAAEEEGGGGDCRRRPRD